MDILVLNRHNHSPDPGDETRKNPKDGKLKKENRGD